ncbi:hypothetical protein D3C81_1573220 [compost metagenome]
MICLNFVHWLVPDDGKGVGGECVGQLLRMLGIFPAGSVSFDVVFGYFAEDLSRRRCLLFAGVGQLLPQEHGI